MTWTTIGNNKGGKGGHGDAAKADMEKNHLERKWDKSEKRRY